MRFWKVLIPVGLGFGFGYSFGSLTKELRELIFAKLNKSTGLAEGLGFGLGFTTDAPKH